MGNHGPNQENEPLTCAVGFFGAKGLQVLADRDYSAGDEVRWRDVDSVGDQLINQVKC